MKGGIILTQEESWGLTPLINIDNYWENTIEW